MDDKLHLCQSRCRPCRESHKWCQTCYGLVVLHISSNNVSVGILSMLIANQTRDKPSYDVSDMQIYTNIRIPFLVLRNYYGGCMFGCIA